MNSKQKLRSVTETLCKCRHAFYTMPFQPTQPFSESDFPNDGKTLFPIVEVFGYDKHLRTDEARRSFDERRCPFAGRACEKYQQYGFGYCSVQYKSKYDSKPEIYAVCDHRLDGSPVQHAVVDFFGNNERVKLVEELKFTDPDQSFDFIAIDPTTDVFIGIETQAIDLRGGGVGPAWESIADGTPSEWRAYFSREAAAKKRKDNVAYGVNMANITKRLGLQVAEKGNLMRQLNAKLYVVAQDRCLEYFKRRIPARWTTERNDDWDISFITFDYTGVVLPSGRWNVEHRQTIRTTLASFSEALSRSTANIDRGRFLQRIKEKLK